MINLSKTDFDSTPYRRRDTFLAYEPADRAVEPLVSIVTPFFNTGEEFDETVEVVLSQSLQNWEWLIVDDCSTDPAARLRLEAAAARDSRIRVIALPANQGPSHARNTGISQARGEYVFQLDSDDLFEPTTLEKLVWYLEVNPHLSFARGYEVGFGAEQYLWREGFHRGKEFLQENFVQTNSLVRRVVFEVTGGYDESIRHGFEDWDFWLRCAANGLWGDTLPEFLHWYRRRSNHGDRWKDFESGARKAAFREALRKRHQHLTPENFPQLTTRAVQEYGTPALAPRIHNRLARGSRRLLFIVPHFEMGGADKFNLDLARTLREQHGWEITVVSTLSPGATWQHLYAEITSDVFILQNFLHVLDYPSFLAYLIESRGYDALLLSNSIHAYNLLPFLRARFPRLPLVDYIHMEEEYWRSGGYARFSINYAPFLDRTVVSSLHLKKWLTDRGRTPDSVDVAYTNIDPALWSRRLGDTGPVEARWGLDGDACRVLFAGRFCDQKQPELLCAVARALIAEGLPLQFLIAGDGPMKDHFVRLAQDCPPGQVRLLGPLSSAEIREVLACVDVFFLPSKMEGIALVLFEAMSMEVVPVGARVGGQAELVTPDCGVLIDRTMDECAQYCVALRGLVGDPARRRQMARSARKRIEERFTLEKLTDQMHRTLLEVHERRGGAPEAGRLPAAEVLVDLLTLENLELRRLDAVAQALWHERSSRAPAVASHEWTELSLYVDSGHGYQESETIKRAIPASQDLDVWIPIPQGTAGGRLRLDPVCSLGTVTIRAVYLRWTKENLAFWQADTPESLIGSLDCQGTSRAFIVDGAYKVVSFGLDPILFLPYVVPPDPNAPVMLEVLFRFDPHLPPHLLGSS